MNIAADVTSQMNQSNSRKSFSPRRRNSNRSTDSSGPSRQVERYDRRVESPASDEGSSTATPLLRRVMLGLKSPTISSGSGHAPLGVPLPSDPPLASPATGSSHKKKSQSPRLSKAFMKGKPKRTSSSSSQASLTGSIRGTGSVSGDTASLDGFNDSIMGASVASLGRDPAIPMLYRHGRKCQWEELAKVLETSPEDTKYVYPKDGTNTLHMVVMSRTGYINTFKKSKRTFPEAPLSLVENILKLDPDCATVPCTLNGYTPLTYACLVCNQDYDVEHMAPMIRLFLKYSPQSINVFTKEGLSPVDVHIVSYSHHHKAKEEVKRGLGHSSTDVLRLLLAHSPELANLRLRGEKVEGPLEYLYRCNTSAFSEAVLNEIYDSDEEGTMLSNFTLPERRQQVVDAVSKWWIWKWAVMILKYGSWKQKKREARFSAVHTAAGQVGCPVPLLSITLYAFPRQVKQTLESIEGVVNLPLHTVCAWPCHQDYVSSADAIVSSRKSMAISRILEEYPDAAKQTNSNHETCLELALKTGTTWDHGVRRLVRTYPKAIKLQSRRTGLYPFMTAAAAAPKASFRKHTLKSVRTIYGLLRSNPKVLIQCHQKGVHQREELEQKRAIMFKMLEDIEE